MATYAELRDAASTAIEKILNGAQSVSLPNGYSYTFADLEKLEQVHMRYTRLAARADRGGRIRVRGARRA